MFLSWERAFHRYRWSTAKKKQVCALSFFQILVTIKVKEKDIVWVKVFLHTPLLIFNVSTHLNGGIPRKSSVVWPIGTLPEHPASPDINGVISHIGV